MPARSRPRLKPPIPENKSSTESLRRASSCFIFSVMKRPKHCLLCGCTFDAGTPWAIYCSQECKAKHRWSKTVDARGVQSKFCRQCGSKFELAKRGHANRRHCSQSCSTKSARESRSKFYDKNPHKVSEYRATAREKTGPDGNLKRFYARHPEAPRACQSCGENRVLDVAHKPEHRRNGAWRSKSNTTLDKVWVLCPTCHALLDRMHYPPNDLGLR